MNSLPPLHFVFNYWEGEAAAEPNYGLTGRFAIPSSKEAEKEKIGASATLQASSLNLFKRRGSGILSL